MTEEDAKTDALNDAVQALYYYANEDNYKASLWRYDTPILYEKGHMARQALKLLRELFPTASESKDGGSNG